MRCLEKLGQLYFSVLQRSAPLIYFVVSFPPSHTASRKCMKNRSFSHHPDANRDAWGTCLASKKYGQALSVKSCSLRASHKSIAPPMTIHPTLYLKIVFKKGCFPSKQDGFSLKGLARRCRITYSSCRIMGRRVRERTRRLRCVSVRNFHGAGQCANALRLEVGFSSTRGNFLSNQAIEIYLSEA